MAKRSSNPQHNLQTNTTYIFNTTLHKQEWQHNCDFRKSDFRSPLLASHNHDSPDAPQWHGSPARSDFPLAPSGPTCSTHCRLKGVLTWAENGPRHCRCLAPSSCCRGGHKGTAPLPAAFRRGAVISQPKGGADRPKPVAELGAPVTLPAHSPGR